LTDRSHLEKTTRCSLGLGDDRVEENSILLAWRLGRHGFRGFRQGSSRSRRQTEVDDRQIYGQAGRPTDMQHKTNASASASIQVYVLL
jgi:hypothetical protein